MESDFRRCIDDQGEAVLFFYRYDSHDHDKGAYGKERRHGKEYGYAKEYG